MKRAATYLIILSVTVFSCKTDKKKMLVGTWQAEKLENADTDSFFSKSKTYIDTMGKGNDDSTNIRIYGVTNMDSMRRILQAQYDSAKAIQDNAVVSTVFTFRKDGIAVISFGGKVDSSKWFMDNGSGLVLEELGGAGGSAGMVKYNIIDLTDKELKLRFYQETDSSTVTFKRKEK